MHMHVTAHLCICQHQKIDHCKLCQVQRGRLVLSCKVPHEMAHHNCQPCDISNADGHVWRTTVQAH